MNARIRRAAAVVAACALLVVFTSTGGTHAFTGSKSHLTFSRPIALPGVVLPAGEYTFEAVRTDIVRVTSRDGRQAHYMGYTRVVPRPRGLDPAVLVSFGEAEAGAPVPVRAWFPEPRGAGHEFIYR